ncbi:MAG: hypothetical protein IT394_00125, partial [Candidatus Omnitrophica bacterium]|nr:hypothetical protein [Candidatus Omnitrophota bacterium]
MPTVEHTAELLDRHVQDIIHWHFSHETGCPFWLDWKQQSGWDPLKEIRCFGDLQKFPHFRDEFLRDEPPGRWVLKAFEGRPYRIFETGGTTGMPKQRISWEDHLIDYSE